MSQVLSGNGKEDLRSCRGDFHLRCRYSVSLDRLFAHPAYANNTRFGFCLDNNQFTVVAEIFPNHMRTLSCSICTSCLYLMQVLWLNLAPTAINNIRWKFYLIFVILGFCGSIHVYIFIPEVSI